MASWIGGSGVCLPFFPLSFSFGVFVTPRSMDGGLEWDFPSGCSFFSFGVALPLQLRWRALVAESGRLGRSSGWFTCPCSRLFSSPIMLPGVVTMLRVCLPRAPALRRVLEAMLAEGALESPLILVLVFHSSLSFVEGLSDGLAASVRFLSSGRLCLIHSVHVEFSR